MTDLDKIDQIIEGLKLASDWEYNGNNFGDMPKKALTTPQARQAIADLLVEAKLEELNAIGYKEVRYRQDGSTSLDVYDRIQELKKGIK